MVHSGGMAASDVLQVWVDVAAHPSRGREQADLIRKRVLRRIWVRLPGRPLLRFLIWYLPRRGFLDGLPGFYFCVLMAYYELTISAKLYELELSGQAGG